MRKLKELTWQLVPIIVYLEVMTRLIIRSVLGTNTITKIGNSDIYFITESSKAAQPFTTNTIQTFILLTLLIFMITVMILRKSEGLQNAIFSGIVMSGLIIINYVSEIIAHNYFVMLLIIFGYLVILFSIQSMCGCRMLICNNL